jgi:hypothetical protein
LDGTDDQKSISVASSFGNAAAISIGLASGDRRVAIKSVTVPLDLITGRKNSISPGSDSVELPKISVSLGRFSGDADQFSGNADQSCPAAGSD